MSGTGSGLLEVSHHQQHSFLYDYMKTTFTSQLLEHATANDIMIRQPLGLLREDHGACHR